MAVNHADGTMFVSVLFFPVAAAVGAHSAGAGWFTALFVPFGLAIGCAVAYAGRKLIYGVLGFAMKTPKGWMQHVVSVPVMIFRFFRDVLGENHWLKRGRWARLFAGAWQVRYAWRPAGPRTVVREPVPAARRPLRIARREIGAGRAWFSTFKVLA